MKTFATIAFTGSISLLGCAESDTADSTGSVPASDTTAQTDSKYPVPPGGHDHGDDAFLWHRDVTAPQSNQPIIILANTHDPVTRKPIESSTSNTQPVTLDFRGFRIRFADPATRWRFEGTPLHYLHQLNLEPHADGSVSQVDASDYPDAVPDLCPMMGSTVDPFGSVYVLHRGWKVYFCCWTGCGDQFMEDPARWYPDYKLEEVEGQTELVAMSEPSTP